MTMKLAAFDLETARAAPDGSDSDALGISCAALAYEAFGRSDVLFWFREPQMTQAECQRLVVDLKRWVGLGYTLLTWNGLGFDFRVLAQESGMYAECSELALNHVDLMLLVTFRKGWFLSLQKALKGAGLEGKEKVVTLSDGSEITDMDGEKAPQLWAAGERQAVLTYLCGDVVQLLRLAQEVEHNQFMHWVSDSGKPHTIYVERLLSARECFDIPEPDTSWMTNPPTRQQFVAWMPDGVQPAAK